MFSKFLWFLSAIFALFLSSTSIADSKPSLLQFDTSVSNKPDLDLKIKKILDQYYQALASGNCEAFYQLTDHSDGIISQQEVCRLMQSKYYDFVRLYHLPYLKVIGRVSEQEEIYFFWYTVMGRHSILSQMAQDKSKFPGLPSALNKLIDQSELSPQDNADFRYVIFIDKKSGKVRFASVNSTAYDAIKNPYLDLLGISTQLNEYYIAGNKKINAAQAWVEATSTIQKIQKAIFAANWDVGGFPLQQAIELDQEIAELKDLAQKHSINTDNIRYCYELAQL